VPLTGGRLTPGVVRVGETVRRPRSSASAFTATLLSYLAAARLGGGPVVCHHDPGPNNTVFRAGRPVAFIDFDFAAMRDPLEDVGYLAWSWCISSKPDRGGPAGQARQVRVLADAYGLGAGQRRRLPAAVEQRLLRNEQFWNERVGRASRVGGGPAPAEVLAWTRRERAFVARSRAVLVAALA